MLLSLRTIPLPDDRRDGLIYRLSSTLSAFILDQTWAASNTKKTNWMRDLAHNPSDRLVRMSTEPLIWLTFARRCVTFIIIRWKTPRKQIASNAVIFFIKKNKE